VIEKRGNWEGREVTIGEAAKGSHNLDICRRIKALKKERKEKPSRLGMTPEALNWKRDTEA